MNTDKFTQKAIEAINNAQKLALEKRNTEVKPEHIAYALVSDKDGLVGQILKKIGVDVDNIESGILRIIENFPTVGGTATGRIYLDNASVLVFSDAEKLAKKTGDEYVSVEHIFVAIIDKVNITLNLLL